MQTREDIADKNLLPYIASRIEKPPQKTTCNEYTRILKYLRPSPYHINKTANSMIPNEAAISRNRCDESCDIQKARTRIVVRKIAKRLAPTMTSRRLRQFRIAVAPF
jgi:hypothetical protein